MGGASTTIMGGSAAAAFVAGMIAFFCALLLGSDDADLSGGDHGGNRIRTARVFVPGSSYDEPSARSKLV
jgi:hypothetical protein